MAGFIVLVFIVGAFFGGTFFGYAKGLKGKKNPFDPRGWFRD